MAPGLEQELLALAEPEQARQLMRFFKTGPGQYGEGDTFLGIKMAPQHALAKKYRSLDHPELSRLLGAPWHEMRMTALLILLDQYRRGDAAGKAESFHFLQAHLSAMNNWDLVDVIVPGSIGDYLYHHPDERGRLQTWLRSDSLWERRIALLASQAFIRQGELGPTFSLCAQVLNDREDLIHKAAGWMLREAGQRNQAPLLVFLEAHAAVMPRTMLRYALEKLSPEQKRDFMGRKARKGR
ncbi:MAG: DNA alkylation repair protein [Candidatus Sericytochromatia bacterium]